MIGYLQIDWYNQGTQRPWNPKHLIWPYRKHNTWSYKLMFGVIYNPTRKSLYYQNLKNLAKNGAITKLSKEKRGNEKCDWLYFKPRFKGNGMKNWPLKRLHCSFISKEILLWAWRASILLLSPGLPPRFFLSIRARSKELWV